MAISTIFFTGETPPVMRPNPMTAMEQLNEWRRQNPTVRLISIETVSGDLLPPMPGDELAERMFDLFRVWYED